MGLRDRLGGRLGEAERIVTYVGAAFIGLAAGLIVSIAIGLWDGA